ncbi:MAG: type II secretion system F family protein [SAR324 cluster bacterium]|nr:type II secretion system F family protein [SAR324 cluster bacterium]
MPIYTYQALDTRGKIKRGSLDAASVQEIRQHLKSQQLFPTEIKLSRFSKKQPTALVNWKKWIPKRNNYSKHLSVFTRQLEVLLDATIPYDKALELIISQTQDPDFQSILSDIRGSVMEGGQLADALGRYANVFPPMYISMVRSGESGGSLGLIMQRLANYYENQDKIRAKLKSAMTYPIFMGVFGVGVVVFMVTYIVPKITQIFESQDALLPLPTRMLIALSDFFANHWLLVLVLTGMSISGLMYFLKTPKGVRFKDKISLKLPLVKSLVIKVMVLRFCQTLGTLLKSGVDLKSALDISKFVVVNHVFINRLEQLILDVNNKGMPLSAAMKRIEYFPEYVHHVVAIGEEAARLDELLERVAERMENEVTSTIDGMTALLQPAMIMVMGAAVGFIALAILLPMLNMSQLLQQ